MVAKKTSSFWRSQEKLKKAGLKYLKAGQPIPNNWPKDFELKGPDGKVYMKLIRGRKVEIVEGTSEPVLEELKKAREALPPAPIDRKVPQERAAIPLPSQAGPVVVGPAAPVADIGIEELHGFVGDLENGVLPEPMVKTDDATTARLGRLFRMAFPTVVISPKVAYVLAVIIWQGKVIVWVIRTKGKQIIAWFKNLRKKKNPEGEQDAKDV